MTDHPDAARRDPQAPLSPDALRGEIGASATLAGGTGAGGTTPAGTPTGTSGMADATAPASPGDTLPGAGLTDHDQPAEGGRDEARALPTD